MSGNDTITERKHYLKKIFMENQHPINVLVVGIGATGSAFCRHLARIQKILEEVDIYMSVTLCDFDHVEKHNVGKQAFSPADIGSNKAIAMSLKINRYYGTYWIAATDKIETLKIRNEAGVIVISCVDTVKARKAIKKKVNNWNPKNVYWMDIGNLEYHGQAILSDMETLPDILSMFPKMKDDESVPTCSVWESISKQSLFINDLMATLAADLLWTLLYYKNIPYHGYFFNLKESLITKLPIPNEQIIKRKG